jgi:imidazolonepropionase-like amidohydrolase
MTATLLLQGGCPCCLARALLPGRTSIFKRASAARYVAQPIDNARYSAQSITKARSATPPSTPLRLRGGTIVNPRDGSIVAGKTVLVDQGRIVALETSGAERSHPSATTIDATGKFIVPGYNDMHSHILELDDPSGALALLLAEGVTGFRQMSGSPERLEQRRKNALPIGNNDPALLELPGTVLTPLNAATAEAAIVEMALQKKQGADFVKSALISGSVLRAALGEARRIGIPLLGHLQDGLDAAEAAQLGFKSIEHLGPGATLWIGCSTEEAQMTQELTSVPLMKAPPLKIPFIRQLIMWRLQSILVNPSAFVPPSYAARLQRALDTYSEAKCRVLAQKFVAAGTWHVPTLVRLRSQELADLPQYANDPYLRFMPKSRVKRWQRVTRRFSQLPAAMRKTYAEAYPRQAGLAKLLSDEGVRMMTGSDGGCMLGPGLTLQEEFVELGKAGIAALKVLQMTTINAAEYLGRTSTMGTVEPGRNADLVLLDANPLERVENLSAIAGVVRAGNYNSRQQLDALKERVATGRGYI